jgi:hypothetical protein
MGGRTGVSPNRSETSRRRGGAPEPVEEASGEEIGPHGHRESFRGDGKSHRAASRREGGGGARRRAGMARARRSLNRRHDLFRFRVVDEYAYQRVVHGYELLGSCQA